MLPVFRFWDKTRERWLNENEVELFYFKYIFFRIRAENSQLRQHIEQSQAIDFEDEQSKMIFTGDYILHKEDDELYEIVFDGEKLIARRHMVDGRCGCDGCMSDDPRNACWTYEDLDIWYAVGNGRIVVGNIFENPKLHETYFMNGKPKEESKQT